MTRWHIYVLMDATGAKRYVGCAIDLSVRLSQHRRAKAWFVNHEIVDVCTDSWAARASEIRWIQRIRAEGAILENQRHNRLSSKQYTDLSPLRRKSTRERTTPAAVTCQASNRAKVARTACTAPPTDLQSTRPRRHAGVGDT